MSAPDDDYQRPGGYTVEPGDVVQITREDHGWYPALIVVSEVKQFGIQGYMTVVTSNDPNEPNAPAYGRLNWGDFEYVGKAVIVAT